MMVMMLAMLIVIRPHGRLSVGDGARGNDHDNDYGNADLTMRMTVMFWS